MARQRLLQLVEPAACHSGTISSTSPGGTMARMRKRWKRSIATVIISTDSAPITQMPAPPLASCWNRLNCKGFP